MIATATSVRTATIADAAATSDILSRAFAADPIFAWMLPEQATRERYTRAFFDIFASFNIEAGTVDLAADHSGVSLWLPFDPADESDDAELGGQLAAACGPFAARLAIVDELMVAAHPTHTPHAYLHFLGTVPERQGTGVGRAVLCEHLRRLDAAGTPAYLEATTVRSAALYQSLGFRRLPQTIDLPDGPSMYPMWREPAAA